MFFSQYVAVLKIGMAFSPPLLFTTIVVFTQ